MAILMKARRVVRSWERRPSLPAGFPAMTAWPKQAGKEARLSTAVGQLSG